MELGADTKLKSQARSMISVRFRVILAHTVHHLPKVLSSVGSLSSVHPEQARFPEEVIPTTIQEFIYRWIQQDEADGLVVCERCATSTEIFPPTSSLRDIGGSGRKYGWANQWGRIFKPLAGSIIMSSSAERPSASFMSRCETGTPFSGLSMMNKMTREINRMQTYVHSEFHLLH